MKIPDSLLLNNKEHTIFQRLSCLFVIYVFPLVLADVLYKDDISRTLTLSPTTWYRDGRPLMAFFIKIFSPGMYIPDISPLPLLAGILALAYALACFARKYLPDLSDWQKVICTLAFVISPLFLENLSFKFESFGMCLTLALFLFLFSLPEKTSVAENIIASFLLTMTVLLTYQASIGAFLGLLVLTALLEMENQPVKRVFLSAFYKVLGFLSSFIIYMLFLVPVFVATDGYQGHVSPRIPNTMEGFHLLILNISNCLQFFKKVFLPGFHSPVTWLSAVCLLVVLLYTFSNVYRHIKNSQFVKALFVFFSPVLIVLFSFLPLCFLKLLIMFPRPFLSFNVFFLLIGIAIVSLARSYRYIILLFIPVYLYSFCFMSAYSNLLHTQRQYEEFIAESVAYDLRNIESIDNSFKFHIDGKIMPSKELALARRRYSIFNYLIINMYNEFFWFGGDLVSHYTNFNFIVQKMGKVDYRQYKMVTGNSLYRIMQNGKTVIVDFKQP